MRRVGLRPGTYVDSVSLMQVSKQVAALPGVRTAVVAMATELNLDLATDLGFAVPACSPNDLMVAVDADSEADLDAADAETDAALTAVSHPTAVGFGSAPPPVTVRAAAVRARTGEASLALVSTPGEFAFADAVDAVDAGLHTMVFSDNVPLAQEVALKDRAAATGALVMGPDCGTAVVGGVGLGFANVVRPGPVGLVAASGTGAQHLMSLLDGAGVGISHCLGVGGRDLSAPVAGRSTLRALDLLDADDDTRLIVVVSKPPDPAVAEAVRAHAAGLATPVRFALLAPGEPDLTETAAAVVADAGGTWAAPEHWTGAVARGRDGGSLRGLYAGGTLCDEAMLIATETLGPVRSNIPLDPAWRLGDDLASAGHTMVDFGDDRLTRGRPHPMIDGAPRADRVLAEVADPGCGVLLVDVVLGLGAADDPAGDLTGPIHEATAAGVPVVAVVVGTDDDPQGLRAQVAALHQAGAWVFRSNAAAARCAVDLLGAPS